MRSGRDIDTSDSRYARPASSRRPVPQSPSISGTSADHRSGSSNGISNGVHGVGSGTGRGANGVSSFMTTSNPDIRAEAVGPRTPRGANNSRLRVVLRLRPPVNPAESERWKLLHDEGSAQIIVPASDGSSQSARRFSADAVCGPESSQPSVYAHLRPCVARCLSGGRAGVVCFGGTGAGKSYTLMCTHIGEWGVAPRAVSEICTTLDARAAEAAKAGGGAGSGSRGATPPPGEAYLPFGSGAGGGGSGGLPACAEIACLLLHDEHATDLLRATQPSAADGPPGGSAAAAAAGGKNMGSLTDADAMTATIHAIPTGTSCSLASSCSSLASSSGLLPSHGSSGNLAHTTGSFGAPAGAHGASPASPHCSREGSLLSSALWLPARTARDGLLLLQRCQKGRALTLAQLGATSASVHTVVLVRTPPPAAGSSSGGGGGAASPPTASAPSATAVGGNGSRHHTANGAISPPLLYQDGDDEAEGGGGDGSGGDGGGGSRSGGLLCFIECAAAVGEEAITSARGATHKEDTCNDTLKRCLAALAPSPDSPPPTSTAQQQQQHHHHKGGGGGNGGGGGGGGGGGSSRTDAAAAPFFESTLTSLLHDAGMLHRGADTTFLACVAPGKQASTASLATLTTSAAATRVRLAPPEPTSPRGLTSLVASLRRQLAQAAATQQQAASQQQAEKERLERENAALTSQLRTQLAAEATWRDEVAELSRRAEAAEAALEIARDGGGGNETLQVEFAREARVLGLLCRQEGRHEASLRLQQRAKKLHERAHGAKHHEVGRDLSHIGNCLCDLGRLDEALAAFRDAHAIDTAALGAEHIHTVTDSAALGAVLVNQRKFREATPHLELAMKLLSASLEPNHPNLQAVRGFLNECHEQSGA